MVIGDLLGELRNNLLRDFSDQIAGTSDRLWSDDTLLRYIKDGERRFARRALCIRDSTTPAVTRVTLKTGITTYGLHPSAIAVLSARWNTDMFDIQRSGHALVGQATPPEVFTYDPVVGFNTQPGRPIAYYTDETTVFAGSGRVTLSVHPAPSTTENNTVLYLRVIRNPLTGYTTSDLETESEIPEDYQFDCLEWAAYRALRHFDADAGASTPSEHHKAAFDEAVLNARKELKHTLFANMTLRYGSNGFAYTP
jgi:hypothetical protein